MKLFIVYLLFSLSHGLYFPPYNVKCKTCKYVKYISPHKTLCKKIIKINNQNYIVNNSDVNIYDNSFLLTIQNARKNNSLCGENATLYKRRLL